MSPARWERAAVRRETLRARLRARRRTLSGAGVFALLFSLLLLLAFAGPAHASDWTEVPFPAGETVWDVAQDSGGNIWATTLEQSGTFGHIEVLWKDASQWEDACSGLDWNSFQWDHGLIAVGDKLFLVVSDGQCYTRSPGDASWQLVDTSQRFYDELVEWDGYLWGGSGYLGVGRLDPGNGEAIAVNDGLPLDESKAFWRPRGNSKNLYVGFTVEDATAADPSFGGVGVYRLRRGSSTWEDTGLKIMPLGTDFDPSQTTSTTDWGVWGVSVVDGYVLAEVSAPSQALTSRLFLFDEAAGTWSAVALPTEKPTWYGLESEASCIAWKGKFYFPTGIAKGGASFDIFDPASKTWSTGVTVSGTGWAPLGNTAQLLGNELLVDVAGGGSSGATNSGSDSGGSQTTETAEPNFVESVPLPTQISTDPGVIGTNFGLALLFAVIFGFTSTLFNNTLKANGDRIARALAPVSRAVRRVGDGGRPLFRRLGNWMVAFAFRSSALRRVAPRTPHISGRWLERLVIVVLAALIYAFLDPTFGFSHHGVGIYFALLVTVAAVTMAWEGIQAFVSARGYRIPAAVKLFPAAIAIAVLCVLLSRLSGFTPGYLYGFVGGLAFLGGHPEERKRGRLVLVGAVCLLAVSVAAWFLAMPLSKVAEGGSWWATFLQSICAGIFVAGLEGLLFGLVPLSFMEGGSLFRWSKVLWSAMFGVALFLFWHVLLNKNSKYGAAFENTNTQVVLALLGFWTVVTVGTFLLFRRSRPRAPAAQGPFQQPPPGWGQQQPWGQPPQYPAGAPQQWAPPPPPPPSWPPPPR